MPLNGSLTISLIFCGIWWLSLIIEKALLSFSQKIDSQHYLKYWYTDNGLYMNH